jgi:two-component system response regulator WspF
VWWRDEEESLMRVALVNDVAMVLEVLRRVVLSIAGVEVAWTAADGREAVEKCQRDTPDLILMDMIMPVMDGVEATRQIMQQSPCPILVVTATVSGNASRVYEALGHGALDAVNTPVMGRGGDLAGAESLVRKIRTVEQLAMASLAKPATAALPTCLEGPASPSIPPVVAIGASTGGPQALVQILATLPSQRSFATVIVQHLDALFAPGLAQWLTVEADHAVHVIESGEAVSAGCIAVAGTGDHVVIDRRGRLRYIREPVDYVYRPSVDVFFHSLLAASIPAATAALLTGMGRDGSTGLKALRDAGWETIAQDEATSVIWGMPGAAVQLDAADHVLPLSAIGQRIGAHFARKNVNP